jgi:hypothetical protein
VLLPAVVSIVPSLELVSSVEEVARGIIVFRVSSLIELNGGSFEVLWVTTKVEIRSLRYLVTCCTCIVFFFWIVLGRSQSRK